MKGYEALKLLAEGKKVTTVNGLIGLDFYVLRDNTHILGVKDSKIIDELGFLVVQDIFVGNDWIEYKTEAEKKHKEYHEILNEVRKNNEDN